MPVVVLLLLISAMALLKTVASWVAVLVYLFLTLMSARSRVIVGRLLLSIIKRMLILKLLVRPVAAVFIMMLAVVGVVLLLLAGVMLILLLMVSSRVMMPEMLLKK